MILNSFLNTFNTGINTKGAILIGLLLAVYATMNALFIHSKYIEIKTKKIKKWTRITQISDIHIGATHKKNFLEKIVNKINKTKPDIVLITGELIDGKHKYKEHYFETINKIEAPLYMILGNHEIITGLEETHELLEKTKIKMLRNETTTINNDINLTGVDDSETQKIFRKNLETIEPDREKYNVIMHHRPIGIKEIQRKGFDLYLAGHTHAGQLFPFNLLIKIFFKYIKGSYTYKNLYLYVSPGTGWWGPPMRLGSKNEITIFDIKPDK